ncbi:hypothetical protein J6590_033117 [Homalodisca vitripennis]|nr:hypothetical protein J6590_033117 [Homalodisca vitripennis]
MKVSKTSASLKPFIPQNRNENSNPPAATSVVRSRSAYQDDTEEMLSWERLRTTFSNKNPLQAPYMNFPECMAGIPEKYWADMFFTSSLRTAGDEISGIILTMRDNVLVSVGRGEPSLYSENCASLCFPPQQLSSTAVQVNIDHCADCRRHRKYGKPLRIETNGSDCDSESSQAESVLPISVNKRLKPFTCRRSPKTRHKDTCQQQLDDLCNEDDQEETAECMYECGHKIGKTDGDKDSDEASDIVQAQSGM